MYAIKTRNGQVYMKLQSNGGDTSVMQVSQPQTVCASDRCLCSDCLYGPCTATLLHHCHCTCGWLLRRCTATPCKSVDYMHIVVDLTTACPHLSMDASCTHSMNTSNQEQASKTVPLLISTNKAGVSLWPSAQAWPLGIPVCGIIT